MISVILGIFPTVPKPFRRDISPALVAAETAGGAAFGGALDLLIERFFSKSGEPHLQPNATNLCLLTATHALESTSITLSVELLQKLSKKFRKEFDSPENQWKAYSIAFAGGATIFTIGLYPINHIKRSLYKPKTADLKTAEISKCTEENECNFKAIAKAWTVNAAYGAGFGGALGYLSPKIKIESGDYASLKLLLKNMGVIGAASAAGLAAALPLKCTFYGSKCISSKEVAKFLQYPIVTQF